MKNFVVGINVELGRIFLVAHVPSENVWAHLILRTEKIRKEAGFATG